MGICIVRFIDEYPLTLIPDSSSCLVIRRNRCRHVSLDQRFVGTVPTTLPPSHMFLQSPYASVGITAIFLVLAHPASAAVATTPHPLLVDCTSLDCVAIDLSTKFVLSIPSAGHSVRVPDSTRVACIKEKHVGVAVLQGSCAIGLQERGYRYATK